MAQKHLWSWTTVSLTLYVHPPSRHCFPQVTCSAPTFTPAIMPPLPCLLLRHHGKHSVAAEQGFCVNGKRGRKNRRLLRFINRSQPPSQRHYLKRSDLISILCQTGATSAKLTITKPSLALYGHWLMTKKLIQLVASLSLARHTSWTWRTSLKPSHSALRRVLKETKSMITLPPQQH